MAGLGYDEPGLVPRAATAAEIEAARATADEALARAHETEARVTADVASCGDGEFSGHLVELYVAIRASTDAHISLYRLMQRSEEARR